MVLTQDDFNKDVQRVITGLSNVLGREANALDMHAFMFADIDERLKNYIPPED